MLNKITKRISASLRGLFFCGCNPEASNPTPDRNIASRSSQGTRLSDPSDVASETPKAPTREKPSHSVSNGSSGDQSGMAAASQDTAARGVLPDGTDQPFLLQDEVLQPDMLSFEMDIQNRFAHPETLAQYPQVQPANGPPEVEEVASTVPSSVMEGSDETMDGQSLPVRQRPNVVMPLEMDSQKLAVGRETPGSQLGLRDVAYGSSQGQVTDNNVGPPASTVDAENHPVTPAIEPQGIMAQPSPVVREKLPRRVGGEAEVRGDQSPQTVKERSPRKTRVAEDDHPPQIIQGETSKKRKVEEEENVENAQPSRITKVW